MIPNIKTPKDLLSWMDKNLTYHGVSKDYLYTANDVVKLKKAHCWESSDLEYKELTRLGYKCQLLYLEDKNVTVTHTAVIYEDNSKYYWFEWAWYKHAGIHGPFNTSEELIKLIIANFINSNHNCNIARLGHISITDKMTQVEYRDKVLKMKHIATGNKPPIYSKW